MNENEVQEIISTTIFLTHELDEKPSSEDCDAIAENLMGQLPIVYGQGDNLVMKQYGRSNRVFTLHNMEVLQIVNIAIFAIVLFVLGAILVSCSSSSEEPEYEPSSTPVMAQLQDTATAVPTNIPPVVVVETMTATPPAVCSEADYRYDTVEMAKGLINAEYALSDTINDAADDQESIDGEIVWEELVEDVRIEAAAIVDYDSCVPEPYQVWHDHLTDAAVHADESVVLFGEAINAHDTGDADEANSLIVQAISKLGVSAIAFDKAANAIPD